MNFCKTHNARPKIESCDVRACGLKIHRNSEFVRNIGSFVLTLLVAFIVNMLFQKSDTCTHHNIFFPYLLIAFPRKSFEQCYLFSKIVLALTRKSFGDLGRRPRIWKRIFKIFVGKFRVFKYIVCRLEI